ncbi:MAG: hypothetical protein E7B11_04100 [Clostridiales bacterium]|nr:hypothetical protein [Clostridiales bacterium]MDU3239742.1 hypothetical protein [Clostridiales bacterium]
MIKTFKIIFHLKTVMQVNVFLYYLKRLWVVGKLVPDQVYGMDLAKKVLTVLIAVLKQIVGFAGKGLYLAVMVGLPILFMGKNQIIAPGERFLWMVHILFFMNCILGPLQDSQVFSVTRQKITCIKYMQMDAARYVQATLLSKYVPFFVYYLPFLMIAARMAGGSVLQGAGLWLLFLSFRMMGEALQVYLYDKKGFVLSRNMGFAWGVILVSLAAAYIPFFLHLPQTVAPLIIHPVFVLLAVLAGAAAFYYIMWGYKGYGNKLKQSIELKYLFSDAMKQAKQSSFAEVEMKEKDLKISQEKVAKYQNRKGYAYMNAIFFARHRRQLVRPIYYRLAITAGILAGGIFLFVSDKNTAVKLSENLCVLLPYFVFIMYAMSVGDKSCRAMFYNCDISLLRYGYYRKPGTILQNFKIRLIRISLYNLAVGIALCAVAVIFCILCQTTIFSIDLLAFSVSVMLLAVLFTVHHLFLYYVFQPYSTGLDIKNPFFTAINSAMYFICFMCLKIEAGGAGFTMAVLAFTICYIAVALVLVYRLAPRYFRIK